MVDPLPTNESRRERAYITEREGKESQHKIQRITTNAACRHNGWVVKEGLL
jgi:hypothetical protein